MFADGKEKMEMYVEVTWFGMIVFFVVFIIERRKSRKRDECPATASDCEKHESRSDDSETTDPIDKEGYEWWNDPRWRE